LGASLANFAIRCCFVKTDAGHDVPTAFPSNDSVFRQPLGSSGSLGLVPRLQGYYWLLRIPAVPPAALRFLRLAVPPCARCSYLPEMSAPPPPSRGCLICGFPNHCSDGENDRASQVPGGPPCTCPALRPRRNPRPRPVRVSDAAFHFLESVGFRIGYFGAQSHGLCIPRPTLRSPGHPGTTQGWVLAVGQLCQMGWLPTGSHCKVSV